MFFRQPHLFELFLILHSTSQSTYFVGGCVRDMLLDRTPNDFDIVIDFDFEKIRGDLIDNGWKIDEYAAKYFVWTVSKNKNYYEIARMRVDGGYSDGRRPDVVSIGNIHQDAHRRDFTINALYYNPIEDLLLDPTGFGLQDIALKIIRVIGQPVRIIEDLRRIDRALVFAARLGFKIEENAAYFCSSSS